MSEKRTNTQEWFDAIKKAGATKKPLDLKQTKELLGAEEAEPPQFVVALGSMKRLRRVMKKRLEEDRAEPIGSDANPDEDRPY